MRAIVSARGRRGGALLLVAMLVSACSSDRIVFRDREMVPVSDAAAKFVGMADTLTKVTVCGTCHKQQQENWSATAHANAWKTLKASDHAADYCQDCHTTGRLGNGNAVDGGWTTTKEARYQNVQCESCHGPGLDHASNPLNANIPLASMAASGDPKQNVGCAGCHNGDRHPYAEEWAGSAHGEMPYTSEDPSHIVVNTSCQVCHSGEFALRTSQTAAGLGFKAGVTRGYKEATKPVTADDFQKLTCTVCHDPHKDTPSQLRFPVATTDTAQNLCIRCHSRNTANPSSWRGPHSTAGQVVLGLNAGWRPPGFMAPLPAAIVGSHANPQANPKQCATCHMPRYDITDAAGKYVATTVGHTFNGFPCKDEKGRPVGGKECGLEERSFKGCVGSGCHSSEGAARNLYVTVEHRLEYLMEELKALLENTAKVSCAEFVYKSKPVNVARGARYNYLLAAGHGHQEVDVCSPLSAGEMIRSLPAPVPSHGAVAHNPAYMEQLLTSSIRAVKATYYK